MPGCPNSTLVIDPATSTAKQFGQVAHIVAASDGGPRAPENLSIEDRQRYAALIADRAGEINAVVLCQSCHGKADRETDTFSVEELFEARREDRERRVRNNPAWDPAQRRGLGRLNTSDYTNDREILDALVRAIAKDPAADGYAHFYGQRDELKRLAGRASEELSKAHWATVTFLAKCAVQLGEWRAAEQLWIQAARAAVTEVAGEDVIAASWAQAASAARRDGRDEDGNSHLEKARKLNATLPEVILAPLTSPIPIDELAELDPLVGTDAKWEAQRNAHLCISFLFVHELDQAQAAFDQIERGTLPKALTVGLELNLAVEQARQAAWEGKPYPIARLEAAYAAAVEVLAELNERGRSDEAVRTRMLAAEALTQMNRFDEANALLAEAVPAETQRHETRCVLASAYINAGNQAAALRLLNQELPGDDTDQAAAELRLLKAEAATVNPLTAERAKDVIDDMIDLSGHESWVGKAAAATAVQLAGVSKAPLPPEAEKVLTSEHHRDAIRQFKCVIAASERDADWRVELGDYLRRPGAVRSLLLRLHFLGSPASVCAAVARYLLTLDCSPMARYVAADLLRQTSDTPEEAIDHLVALGRDRNASSATRADAYDSAFMELRRTNRMTKLKQLYDEELAPLANGKGRHPQSVREILSRWMPTASRVGNAGRAGGGSSSDYAAPRG